MFVALLQELEKGERGSAGDLVEEFLASRSSDSEYWPSDGEVKSSLNSLGVYRSLRRARLRMMLEAIEDHRRGFSGPRPLHEQRVVRGTCSVEHIMPQQWTKHWPISGGDEASRVRDAVVQRIGNLTLVTQQLNSTVSNSAWLGDKGKREVLALHTSLMITREVTALDVWDEAAIATRTEQLVDDVLEIWPAPEGLESSRVTQVGDKTRYSVTIADLVGAGMLQPGQLLYSRRTSHQGMTASVSADGHIFVGESSFRTPSGAAKHLAGTTSEPGWWFWLVDVATEVSLADLRREYLEAHNEIDDEGDDLADFG